MNASEHSASDQKSEERTAIGPLGERISLSTLPPVKTRWIARRKAEVVAALQGGLLGFEEACLRYDLSAEELAGWQRAIQREGMQALKVTRLRRPRKTWAEG